MGTTHINKTHMPKGLWVKLCLMNLTIFVKHNLTTFVKHKLTTFVIHKLTIIVKHWLTISSTMTYPWAHENHVSRCQVVATNYNMGQYTSLHWYAPWYKLQLHVNKGSYRFPICHMCTYYPVTLLHDHGLSLSELYGL